MSAARGGMGAVLHDGGTTFRVWAPHASAVAVAGDFNGWSGAAHPLNPEPGGYWAADVAGVTAGAQYRFVLDTPAGRLSKIDPYARAVTNSQGNAIVFDPAFDWGDAPYRTPPWHELVIYEIHVGTFNDAPGGRPGRFESVETRLDYLRDLGVNAIELMPIVEFHADFSWGYNPSHLFAPEESYGGPDALKRLVRSAHERGIAVLGDVVFNHFGPEDLHLWQFDGWQENGKGGIYFYNDWRSSTAWAETRPDYGRPEVRAFLADNARYWLEEFRFDGLRWDMTLWIRNALGRNDDPAHDIADGWRLFQDITGDTDRRQPWKVHIAEDLQANPWLTRAAAAGGAGFDSQWAAEFVHPVRGALVGPSDGARSMEALRAAVGRVDWGDPASRIVYTESHDEVSNGRARVPYDIAPGDPGGYYARKRSTLGAVLVFTSPGIPMIFQGQEFLEDEWFRDTDPLDWDKTVRFAGILNLYRDLIRLRRNWSDRSRGLRGRHVNVHHVNDGDKVLAYHRWEDGGPGDDVVVVANFSDRVCGGYRVGVPRGGTWRVRCNTDWIGYSPDYGDVGGGSAEADGGVPWDGLPASIVVDVGRYSALILSQDP